MMKHNTLNSSYNSYM